MLVAIAAPAFAYAASVYDAHTVVYQTAIRPFGSSLAYPVTGELQIKTSSDGIISGYYRPGDNNDFVPVTGAVRGNHVWIDIGRANIMRVDAAYGDGTIVGTAFGPNHDLLSFSANDAHVQQ